MTSPVSPIKLSAELQNSAGEQTVEIPVPKTLKMNNLERTKILVERKTNTKPVRIVAVVVMVAALINGSFLLNRAYKGHDVKMFFAAALLGIIAAFCFSVWTDRAKA